MNSVLNGQQETCPHNVIFRFRASLICDKSLNTPSGSVLLCNNAAIMTGRCVSAARLAKNGTGVGAPLVSMNTPFCCSPKTPTSRLNSSLSARRDGMGWPSAPLWDGDVEVAKPTAPTLNALATISHILSTSLSDAGR